jgi:PAS domain-containing protein
VRNFITKGLGSIYIDVPALRPGSVGAYVLAVLSVGVATALRLAVDPYVVGAQFVTFFPAVVITTLISGFGAGFFCAVLSTAAADFFVLSPRWSFSVEDPANVADLLLFGPLAFYCVILIGRMRMVIEHEQAERALRASKDRLQLALDAALLGWWRYEPRDGLVSGDRRFKEIFDVTKDQMPIEEIKNLVHPDDAERFSADSEASLDPADPQRPRGITGFSGETAKSAGWKYVGWLVSRAPGVSAGARASLAPWRRSPNARSARNGT